MTITFLCARRPVGAVVGPELYGSPNRWVFVPYHFKRERGTGRATPEPSIAVGPAPVAVAVVPDTRPGRLERAVKQSPFIVLIDNPAGPALLKVPQADVVVARLMDVSAEQVEVSDRT